jgi:hypothetical protein
LKAGTTIETAGLKAGTTIETAGLKASGPHTRSADLQVGKVGPKKKSQAHERFRSMLLALRSSCESIYACSPLGATDVRPQSSHVR